jgi:hypothetical protein
MSIKRVSPNQRETDNVASPKIQKQAGFGSAILVLSNLTERRFYAGRGKGNLADARAGSIKNRISDC